MLKMWLTAPGWWAALPDMVNDGTQSVSPLLHIVHADPVKEILQITAEQLTASWGDRLDIRSFAEGEAAARFLLLGRDFLCDLAVVDAGLQRPGDALELVQIVRDCGPRCPVILTCYDDTPVDPRLLTMGVEVLQKPFGVERLSQTIRRLVECHHSS